MDSLSPAVSEILGAKRIGVTEFDLLGHVTSSVNHLISYRPSPIDGPLEPRLIGLSI